MVEGIQAMQYLSRGSLPRDLHNLWLRFVAIRCKKPKHLHDGREYAHLLYFAAVFVEGHGMYATMGGALLVLGAAALFFKDGEP
jgi:hypothetical protein